MTCRHRFTLSSLSSAIAIALVIGFATALPPLSARADSLEAESSRGLVEASALQSAPSPATTPAGLADLLSLAFIAMLWTLNNRAARHHRSVRPRRRTRTAT